MHDAIDSLQKIVERNGLVAAFALVGATMWFSYFLSDKVFRGRLQGSAIAIMLGLAAAYFAGIATGGSKGVADVHLFAGVGLLGGAMIRDLAIVATAFGVNLDEVRRAGLGGVVALFVGVLASFFSGAAVAYAFGYTDAVSVTTIGGGAATYVVGPVTGVALGASSDVIALSMAAGLAKAIFVMAATPLVAKRIGLDNPRSAMVFGGLLGTTSGVSGGLAATDPKLVPYGAMTANFYTAIGCLIGPSVAYMIIRSVL